MYRNVDNQKIAVYAWKGDTGGGKTGDAANITAQISIDGAACAATNDANPTELDAVDAPGVYIFDATQAESNGDLIVVMPASSTPDVVFRPSIIYTNPLTPTQAAYIDQSIATTESNIRGADSDDLADLSGQLDACLTTGGFLALK